MYLRHFSIVSTENLKCASDPKGLLDQACAGLIRLDWDSLGTGWKQAGYWKGRKPCRQSRKLFSPPSPKTFPIFRPLGESPANIGPSRKVGRNRENFSEQQGRKRSGGFPLPCPGPSPTRHGLIWLDGGDGAAAPRRVRDGGAWLSRGGRAGWAAGLGHSLSTPGVTLRTR